MERRKEAYVLLAEFTEEGVLDARVAEVFSQADLRNKVAASLDNLVAKDGKLFIKADLDLQYEYYTELLKTLEKDWA